MSITILVMRQINLSIKKQSLFYQRNIWSVTNPYMCFNIKLLTTSLVDKHKKCFGHIFKKKKQLYGLKKGRTVVVDSQSNAIETEANYDNILWFVAKPRF